MNRLERQKERQNKLFDFLEGLDLGVINIADKKLAMLIGCSPATVKRDLAELDGKRLIVRETNLIRVNGTTHRQRDILIPGQLQRRFSLLQHKELSKWKNHRVSTNEFNEIVWERLIDDKWQRNMIEKEFKSEGQVKNWIFSNIANHRKAYTIGEKYSSRTGNE